MVGLNPVLRCLMAVEEGVSRGDAVRDVVLNWYGRETALERDFQREILEFLRQTESRDAVSHVVETDIRRSKTIYRQSLLSILAAGVQGNSVLSQLKELRIEIEEQLELDMKAHVDSLPLKMLVPLLLCMFPAFLILLLGPITQNFMEAMK